MDVELKPISCSRQTILPSCFMGKIYGRFTCIINQILSLHLIGQTNLHHKSNFIVAFNRPKQLRESVKSNAQIFLSNKCIITMQYSSWKILFPTGSPFV